MVVHAAKSMILSLATSVLNLGFSLVVKSVGVRNCLNPPLKFTTDVSIACDGGFFRSWDPLGVRKALG